MLKEGRWAHVCQFDEPVGPDRLIEGIPYHLNGTGDAPRRRRLAISDAGGPNAGFFKDDGPLPW